MAIRGAIQQVPRKLIAAVSVPTAAVIIAVTPTNIGLATLFVVVMSALAALGMTIFELRRRLLRQQQKLHRNLRELQQQQQELLRRQRSHEKATTKKPPAPRQMDSEELIRLANTYASDDRARLAVINQIYLSARYMPITLADPQRPLSLDNLETAVTPPAPQDPLVSVIMPVHNAEGTVGYALRSVLAQTWQNLEVVVVDDASTDNALAVVEKVAADDPRVNIVRQPVNRGAFAARNAGFAASRGDLITTHDSDDWSHGQMIQAEVETLLNDRDLMAVMVHGTRCKPDVELIRLPWTNRHMRLSYVSLMLRRTVLDEIGLWDEEVRCGADGEFLERTKAAYGKAAVRYIAKETPLMLILKRDGSLSSDGTTGLASFQNALGVRTMYREAFQRWHSSEGFRSDLPWIPGSHERPFPVPRALSYDGSPAESAK